MAYSFGEMNRWSMQLNNERELSMLKTITSVHFSTQMEKMT
jgi:hypothetical protein